MTTRAIAELDRYRHRWRRARVALGLLDTGTQDFAEGGLASRVENLGARLLILPPDPEHEFIDFDATFWEWWEQPRADPVIGRHRRWGGYVMPTAHAAVRYERDGRQTWNAYLALGRHGGMDMGLGRPCVYETHSRLDQSRLVRVFELVALVGQIWTALACYRDVVERFQLDGPWEVTLALRRTNGAVLGDFGTGWRQPGEWGDDEGSNCPDPNLLFRWELETWPEPDAVQALAFRIGGWLEDAWGTKHRRFLAHRGEYEGRFDASRYRPW